GMVRPGSAAAPLELRALLNRMEDVQVLRLSGLSGPRERFPVRVLAPDAAPASGTLARRTSLGYAPERPIPWMAVAFGGVIAAGALSLWVRRLRPMGILRVRRGAPEKTIPLTRRGITIGGAMGNGLVLEDPRVSRNHAVIQVHGSEIKLVDLKSSNGTKVNGARITSHSLRDGDRILLAEAVELVYERRARKPAKREQAPAADRRGSRPAFEEDDDDDDDLRDPLRERRA
ncbi:MAG TPA: FHA domain-containing protein, partial [bacterium]|nr:FHA domain-containing protein [bacterium]